MSGILNGLGPSYYRSIGQQDRTNRTISRLLELAGKPPRSSEPVPSLRQLCVDYFQLRCLPWISPCVSPVAPIKDPPLPVQKNQASFMIFKLINKIAITLLTLFTAMHSKAQKPERNISDRFPYEMKAIEVNGIHLKYYEQGSGEPVLFLHGIPSNSYLWRNVVPAVSADSRAIALDLAGYGESSLPPDGDYSFQSQYTYLKGFIDALNLTNVTLVVNDLGSALGIRYAIKNESNVKALVLVEAAFMPAKEWHGQLTTMQKTMFSVFRKNPNIAELMIVKKNNLPRMVMRTGIYRKLSAEEMKFYTKPYETSEERRRVYLTGPGPATFQRKGISQKAGDFADVLDQNAKGLLSFRKPILLLFASPGLITRKEAILYARENFKTCYLVHVGKGKHFLPEDHPARIGNEISQFLKQW